jgi:hypothetical protein
MLCGAVLAATAFDATVHPRIDAHGKPLFLKAGPSFYHGYDPH